MRVYGDLRACVVRVIDGSSSGSSNSRNIKTVIMMIMTKYRITCESAREREEEREREAIAHPLLQERVSGGSSR